MIFLSQLVGLPDNDFQLNDSFVSRRHCTIYYDDIFLTVSDLKSTNKTILNKRIINDPCSLKNSDKLIVGKKPTFNYHS